MGTTKTTNTDKKTELFLKAFEAKAGNISQACKSANVNRSFYYTNYKENADFKEAVDDITEGLVDFAESCLLQEMRDRNITAIIFYLKTKGKKRGYVERQEIEHEMNEPLRIVVKSDWKPNDE